MNLLNIFRRTCFNRYFELECEDAIKNKEIYIPVYLSLGLEHIPVSISEVCKDLNIKPAIFPQHRNHSYLLSFGGDPSLLAKELLSKPDGLNQGKGGSASIHCKDIKFYGHDGFLGSNAGIATGYCHSSQDFTICQVADASIEEESVMASLGYSVSKKLPILFVCQSDGLSILTRTEQRRSWLARDVARGFGLFTNYIKYDHPKEIYENVRYLIENKMFPAFIEIDCCRHCFHVGAGRNEPKWNTFEGFYNEFEGSISYNILAEQYYKAKEIWSLAKQSKS